MPLSLYLFLKQIKIQNSKMKTKLLIIDRGQLGILTDTLKYCEYLHCHFNITYICFDEHRKK